MKFFDGVRPSAYFQGGRLKKDAKSGVRFWSMTFAITLGSEHVYRCEEVITSNFEQISAEENRCDELAIGISVLGHEVEFYELKESKEPVLRLRECAISHLRMSRTDGLVELWITVEHSNGDALHKFVKDYAFTRLWLGFVPRQGKLVGVAEADKMSAGMLRAIDKMTDPVRRGGLSSLTISTAEGAVTIDKAAADRIHERAKEARDG